MATGNAGDMMPDDMGGDEDWRESGGGSGDEFVFERKTSIVLGEGGGAGGPVEITTERKKKEAAQDVYVSCF